jgi:hypothetical protein
MGTDFINGENSMRSAAFVMALALAGCSGVPSAPMRDPKPVVGHAVIVVPGMS